MWLPLTPLDFYRRARRLFADKTGIVDQGRRLTFGELAERIERLAGALRDLGLRPREPVSVLAPNTHHLFEAFYGVPLAGGVVHPVSIHRAPLEVAELVNDAGSRVLVFHSGQAAVVREVLGNLKAVETFVILEGEAPGLGFPALEYEALLKRARPFSPDLSSLDEDAALALFHTSGGASRPRGVLLTHRGLALHALYAVIAVGLREDDRSLCSVPFSHMNGGGNPQINPAAGAASVLARRNDPAGLTALLSEESVTVWITAPWVLARLLRSAEAPRPQGSSLRLVMVGGAPVPKGLLAEAEKRLGARCVEVYGLTETAPFVTSEGRPVLGVEAEVVDEAGRPVPPDGATLGEMRVRGNAVMSGYHRDPEATQEALRGGWLHTGDLASASPDGRLQVRGRTKDVILVDGRRVPAREIEAVLAAHPDVVECSVVAAPDPQRGEVPVGLVVLRGGARRTERELLDYARDRLLGLKAPGRIEFLPRLPRTEGGEVVKSTLRTLYR